MQTDPNTGKCVIVVDESLPLGMMLNTAAILGVSIGAKLPDILGPDAEDASKQKHIGLIRMNLPVLKANRLKIEEIRIGATCNNELFVVAFSEQAQFARTCEDYLGVMCFLCRIFTYADKCGDAASSANYSFDGS